MPVLHDDATVAIPMRARRSVMRRRPCFQVPAPTDRRSHERLLSRRSSRSLGILHQILWSPPVMHQMPSKRELRSVKRRCAAPACGQLSSPRRMDWCVRTMGSISASTPRDQAACSTACDAHVMRIPLNRRMPAFSIHRRELKPWYPRGQPASLAHPKESGLSPGRTFRSLQ
jgi:hypothetical protein